MTSDRPSDLLDHLLQRLGHLDRVDLAQSEQGNRGYDLCFYDSVEPPVTTVVTNGLRFQAITAMRPEELVCSLRSDQQYVTHQLVDAMASLVLQNQRGMEYGTVLENAEPVVVATEIFGVIGHISPFFNETFNLFPDSESPEIQLITLVPITKPEIDFARKAGPDELFEIFEINETDILDVHRRSEL